MFLTDVSVEFQKKGSFDRGAGRGVGQGTIKGSFDRSAGSDRDLHAIYKDSAYLYAMTAVRLVSV